MKETLKHQQAFEYYYMLGIERSLGKVASHFNISRPTATKWSQDFKWDERVKERDTKNMATIREKNDEDVVEQMIAYRKVIKASVSDYIKRLKDGKVKIDNVNDFTRLVRLDMELCGFVDNTYDNTSVSDETHNTFNQILSGIEELKAGV